MTGLTGLFIHGVIMAFDISPLVCNIILHTIMVITTRYVFMAIMAITTIVTIVTVATTAIVTNMAMAITGAVIVALMVDVGTVSMLTITTIVFTIRGRLLLSR
jgi:hypothetical protein